MFKLRAFEQFGVFCGMKPLFCTTEGSHCKASMMMKPLQYVSIDQHYSRLWGFILPSTKRRSFEDLINVEVSKLYFQMKFIKVFWLHIDRSQKEIVMGKFLSAPSMFEIYKFFDVQFLKLSDQNLDLYSLESMTNIISTFSAIFQ